MATYLISYDLGQPETSADYAELIAHIKSLGSWAKPLQSVWIVKSNLTCSAVRDGLLSRIDANDKVFVVDITGKASAWGGDFNPDVAAWLLAGY